MTPITRRGSKLKTLLYLNRAKQGSLFPAIKMREVIINKINLPELTVFVSASTDSVFCFFGRSSLSSSGASVRLLGVELALALRSIGLPVSGPEPWGVGGLSNRPLLLLMGAEMLGTEFSFESGSAVFRARASSGSESSGAAVAGGLWQP